MNYDKRHGSAYDCGSADAYYGRRMRPHFFTGRVGFSDKIEESDMTPEEIAAYEAGYDDSIARGDIKNW